MTGAAAAPAPHRRVEILGCPFDAIDIEETERFIKTTITRREHAHITVGNVDMVMKVRRDPQLARAFWESNLTIVDGVPITWAAAFLNRPVKGRVSGTDIVWRCARISRELGCSIALVGGAPSAAAAAATNLRERYPGALLNVVPTPFPLTAESSAEVVKCIRANSDKIVLVALGAPRQELWLKENLPATGANVGMGIGSAFDIIGGSRPQAPDWMRRHGLEWLHRMRQEPRRLGRRYLVEDLPFFWYLLKERVRPSTDTSAVQSWGSR
jgi:N-acetylglucosaminyldiphosphoundecaprenol N-acetyl-beta-D-mannosaminyltransferase